MHELVLVAARGPVAAHVPAYAGYRSVDVPPAQHRGLPSPWITVVLALDEPLRIDAHPDARQAAGEFTAVVGGLHTTVHGRSSGNKLHDISTIPLVIRRLRQIVGKVERQLDHHVQGQFDNEHW